MIAELIEKLIANGDFKALLAGGIISPKVKTQYEIYKHYCKLRGAKKGSVRDIVFEVSEDYKVTESTVYAALKNMRT